MDVQYPGMNPEENPMNPEENPWLKAVNFLQNKPPQASSQEQHNDGKQHEDKPILNRSQEFANQFITYYNTYIVPQMITEDGRFANLSIQEFAHGIAILAVALIFSQGQEAPFTADLYQRMFFYYLFTQT